MEIFLRGLFFAWCRSVVRKRNFSGSLLAFERSLLKIIEKRFSSRVSSDFFRDKVLKERSRDVYNGSKGEDFLKDDRYNITETNRCFFFFKQTDKLTIHRNLITVSLKHLAHFTQLVLKSRKFNRLLILLNAKAVLEGDKRRRSRRMKGMHLGWLLGETT